MANQPKVYLGDSVYAEITNGMLKLTTEDGISTSNTIWLEPEVWEALRGYMWKNTPLQEELDNG